MHKHAPILAILALFVIGPLAVHAEEAQPVFQQRWFYASPNLAADKSADSLIALIERAGKSGYNGLVLADDKLDVLDRMPPGYFQNVARVQKAAVKAGIEIIPMVFPIGYSAGLLVHDPNLAEGLPVKDAPFVVKGKEAVLIPKPAVRIVNGGLEETEGDRFVGFDSQDGPGKATFADHETVHGGKVSCRMENVGKAGNGPNGRLHQRAKVRPHACYRFSCWVKTRDFKASEFRLLALGASKGNRELTFFDARLKPTQDWTYYEAVFNSLDENEVDLYAGQWRGKSGTLWLDDLELTELSLVNVLRRDGCPLVVASADGQTTYQEGKDFLPVRDAQLGGTPPGNHAVYSFRHPGAALQLTSDSRIKDGERLRVSWYHPVLTHHHQVMCCLSEPKVYTLLGDQVKRVNDLFKPKTFFMYHDEIRVAGWCRACRQSGKTPGALLADNARRCVDLIKEINPQAKIVVWSDMFDPNHNAVNDFYLVNGTWAESWKGLPPEVIVANWNGGKRAGSLNWFAGRGHQQIIAGYYDSNLKDFQKWREVAKGVPNVTGFMYTTWDDNYGLLEAYGKAMKGKK